MEPGGGNWMDLPVRGGWYFEVLSFSLTLVSLSYCSYANVLHIAPKEELYCTVFTFYSRYFIDISIFLITLHPSLHTNSLSVHFQYCTLKEGNYKGSYMSHTGGCAWKKQPPVWRGHGGQKLHSWGRTTYQSSNCHSLEPKYKMTTSHLVAAKRKQTLHGWPLHYPNKPVVYVRTYLWLTKSWHLPLSAATPSPSSLHKCWEVGQCAGVRS